MATKQEQTIMEKLGCSLDEAKDVIACDKAIDRGERVYFDLTKEEEKLAKKWAHTGTKQKKPTAYKFDKRQTTKPNPTKEGIITMLENALLTCGLEVRNVQVVNKGKLIAFDLGENSFEIDLKQKRKPKA